MPHSPCRIPNRVWRQLLLSAAACTALSLPGAGRAQAAVASQAAPVVTVTLDLSQLSAEDQANPQVTGWGETARAMAQAQFIPLTAMLYPDAELPAELSATLTLIRQATALPGPEAG